MAFPLKPKLNSSQNQDPAENYMFILYKLHFYHCFNPTSNFLDLNRAMGNE